MKTFNNTLAILSALALCGTMTACSTASQQQSQTQLTASAEASASESTSADTSAPDSKAAEASSQTTKDTASESTEVSDQTSTDTSAAEQTSARVSAKTAADLFTDRDYETAYSDFETVDLSAASGEVEITKAGTYLLTGRFNGTITVNADENDKVQLVLDGAYISCEGGAALYIKSADKVFVTTTENGGGLASAGEIADARDEKIDGAVYAKSDITFNGTGALEISCETGHAIVAKDDIKFTGGTYTISSAKKGIDCKESVRIADGDITITSGTDGIHSENDEAEKSFVFVSGGNIKITCGNDCIDCTGEVTLLGGSLDLTAYGGSDNGASHYESFGRGFSQGKNEAGTDADELTGESYKGIKSDTVITIDGAVINADTADDSLHSGSEAYIRSGMLTLLSGDDGIHADSAVYISGGTVSVDKSYEGIEGEVIDISGGVISVVASDDGLNAGGASSGSGGFMDTDANAKLLISGGSLTVNADGDGLDSNGVLEVSGGVTFVSGPTNGGNGALDSGLGATITGGTVIAAGATGMAENFGTASTQCSILYTFDQTLPGGTELVLKDSDGNVIISFTPEKSYQCAVISTPELNVGNTYTVSAGELGGTVELTTTIYGESSGFGNFGGGGGDFGNFGGNGNFGGEKPGRPDGSGRHGRDSSQSDRSENGEIPSFPDMENGEKPAFPGMENGEMPSFPGGENISTQQA